MSSPEDIPYVPERLVVWLEAQVGIPIPSPSDSDRQIWLKVGQWKVVKMLRDLYEKQRTDPHPV